jgi:hypothetical protein
MEVITFESNAYKDLIEKIERIAEYIVKKESALPPDDSSKEDSIANEWLDNDQAPDILGISTRTLQWLRVKNLISYSLLGGKCYYYQISDTETALKNRVIRCNPETIADFRKNYLIHVKHK